MNILENVYSDELTYGSNKDSLMFACHKDVFCTFVLVVCVIHQSFKRTSKQTIDVSLSKPLIHSKFSYNSTRSQNFEKVLFSPSDICLICKHLISRSESHTSDKTSTPCSLSFGWQIKIGMSHHEVDFCIKYLSESYFVWKCSEQTLLDAEPFPVTHRRVFPIWVWN